MTDQGFARQQLPGLLALCFQSALWGMHCPRNVGGASVEFAVNEVRAAPEKQTDRGSDHQRVPQICPGKFVSARVIKSECKNANHSAVTSHAAFPYPQDRERLAQHFRFIKEYVANWSAEQP